MWRTFLAVLHLAAPPSPVTTPETGAPESVVEEARTLFHDAQQLFAQRRYAEAALKFEEAQVRKPHPSLLFNIARCRQALGEVPAALRGYREYLRQTRDSDAELLRLVSQLEAKLRERGVQQLTVYAEPAAAEVAINGRKLGPSPATAELPAGEYEVLVAVPGFQPERRRVSHQLQRAGELVVVLTPLNVPAPPTPAPAAPVPQKRNPAPGEPAVEWKGFTSSGAQFEGSSGTGHTWHSDAARDMAAEQDTITNEGDTR